MADLTTLNGRQLGTLVRLAVQWRERRGGPSHFIDAYRAAREALEAGGVSTGLPDEHRMNQLIAKPPVHIDPDQRTFLIRACEHYFLKDIPPSELEDLLVEARAGPPDVDRPTDDRRADFRNSLWRSLAPPDQSRMSRYAGQYLVLRSRRHGANPIIAASLMTVTRPSRSSEPASFVTEGNAGAGDFPIVKGIMFHPSPTSSAVVSIGRAEEGATVRMTVLFPIHKPVEEPDPEALDLRGIRLAQGLADTTAHRIWCSRLPVSPLGASWRHLIKAHRTTMALTDPVEGLDLILKWFETADDLLLVRDDDPDFPP